MAAQKWLAARQSSRTRQQPSRRNIDLIVRRREELVAEVAQLRDRHGSSKLTENAQQLLTRWWAPAGWTARQDLLKTVDWLVQIEKRRDRMPSLA